MALTLHDDYWDDVPRFGAAGRRWLRRRLYWSAVVWLQGRRLDPENEASQEILASMVRSVAEDWEELITWKDYEQFRGNGFASGEWEIDKEAVAARWPAAFATAVAAEEATRYPTLDAWLDAEVRGELEAPAAEEPIAWKVLGNKTAASDRWLETRNRLEDRWPRVCRTCGGQFTWEETARNRVRCEACCARRPRRQPDG